TLFERRVNKQIRPESEAAEDRGEPIYTEPKFEETCHRERNAEPERAVRGYLAGGKRASRSPAHQAIGFAFIPLIQGGGAGGYQSGAAEGEEQKTPIAGAVPFALHAEEIADARAHQDEPGDPRFSKRYIFPHFTTMPQRARRKTPRPGPTDCAAPESPAQRLPPW